MLLPVGVLALDVPLGGVGVVVNASFTVFDAGLLSTALLRLSMEHVHLGVHHQGDSCLHLLACSRSILF